MKKFLLISLFSVLFSVNYSYSLAPLTSLLQNPQSDEMGKRYIKLGMSWIVSGDLEKAENYLNYGIKIVKRSGNKYWIAVGYEFYGYLNLAKNDRDGALEYLYAAQKLYDKYGTLRNAEGSNISLANLISSIENGDVTIFDNGNSPKGKPTIFTPSSKPKNSPKSNDEHILIELQKHIKELDVKYSGLIDRLQTIEGRNGSDPSTFEPNVALPGR